MGQEEVNGWLPSDPAGQNGSREAFLHTAVQKSNDNNSKKHPDWVKKLQGYFKLEEKKWHRERWNHK